MRSALALDPLQPGGRFVIEGGTAGSVLADGTGAATVAVELDTAVRCASARPERWARPRPLLTLAGGTLWLAPRPGGSVFGAPASGREALTGRDPDPGRR